MNKRISLDQHSAIHLYELALEHFCVGGKTGDCDTCHRLKDRLEAFIGREAIVDVHKTIRENGYCNKLQTSIVKKDLKWIDEQVDNHKHIRAEGTRDRVKLLMMAAMMHAKGIE